MLYRKNIIERPNAAPKAALVDQPITLGRKAASAFFAVALMFSMCPAVGLAYAAETSGEVSSPEHINKDVSLKGGAEVSSPASSQQGVASSEDVSNQNSGGDETSRSTETSFVDASSTINSSTTAKYTSSINGRISIDVPLNGGPTVGVIEYGGLAYTINADDPTTLTVTGVASIKPVGDVSVPTHITNTGKTYTVTNINVSGLDNKNDNQNNREDKTSLTTDINPYADKLFTDKDKALDVLSINISSSIQSIDPAFAQLFPNATKINISENEAYSSFDGALYSADKTKLILVPQGKGSLVLPQQLATVPAYVFSQCNKLSAITFEGASGSDSLASAFNCLYTKDLTTLLAAPSGLGTSVSISPECTTIAEGAFFGNESLTTIVVSGTVQDIASAGDSALDANGNALLYGSQIRESTLSAFSEDVEKNATVVINIANKAENSALLENAKAAWLAYGFSNFKEPALPGTVNKPEKGSGFSYTLLNDYTLSISWVGIEAASAALEVPDYGVIDGVQYTVSTIAPNGFSFQSDINTVKLPQTITTIGDSAFKSCTNLQTIHFDSVITIGTSAFENTSLLSLVLPDTLQTIGDNAFSEIDSATIVAFGNIPNNSEVSLGSSKNMKVYVPLGTENTWVAGLPAYGNHILPYGLKLSSSTYKVKVGDTVSLFDGAGALSAPGDIKPTYSYRGKYLDIDTKTGQMGILKSGSTEITVNLTLEIEEITSGGKTVTEIILPTD